MEELFKKFWDAGISYEATWEQKYSFKQVLTDNSQAVQALQPDVSGSSFIEAIEFAEWIRTFDALDKKDGFWVLESQISSEELYKNYLRDRERWRNDR